MNVIRTAKNFSHATISHSVGWLIRHLVTVYLIHQKVIYVTAPCPKYVTVKTSNIRTLRYHLFGHWQQFESFRHTLLYLLSFQLILPPQTVKCGRTDCFCEKGPLQSHTVELFFFLYRRRFEVEDAWQSAFDNNISLLVVGIRSSVDYEELRLVGVGLDAFDDLLVILIPDVHAVHFNWTMENIKGNFAFAVVNELISF